MKRAEDKYSLKRKDRCQEIESSEKKTRKNIANIQPGTSVPGRAMIGLHLFYWLRLLLAPDAQSRKRSRKQRDAADRQAGINLWSPLESQAISGGACAQRETENHKR
jgi:hypothetical protein